jgi:hypothetical protein
MESFCTFFSFVSGIFFSKGFSPEIITLAFLKSFYRCKISHFTRQKRDPPFKIFVSAGTYLKV